MNANLFSRKIEMTKTEAKAAGKPNTTEYNTLLELMKNFPGFQIEIVKSAAKKADRFKGLDINYMENYIKSHKPELLETFYELRGLDANGKKVELAAAATYGEIKMWFLTQFPEIEKLGENVNKIIEEARKAREEAQAKAAADNKDGE